MTTQEMTTPKTAFMSYSDARMAKDEQDIAELEKERDKTEEEIAEQQEDESLNAEEKTFKKRYGDLRRHSQQKEENQANKIRQLEAQVESLAKKQMKMPKTEEEVEEWRKQYPDVAGVIETMVLKRLQDKDEEHNKTRQEIDELRHSLARDKAEVELARLHPDYDELRSDPNFHKWVEEQPKWVQDVLYENDTDFLGAAKAIDLYKMETQAKPKRNNKGAAEAVNVSRRAQEPGEPGNKWSESRVQKLSQREYEKYEQEIEEAVNTGKFDYDISGAAR